MLTLRLNYLIYLNVPYVNKRIVISSKALVIDYGMLPKLSPSAAKSEAGRGALISFTCGKKSFFTHSIHEAGT